MEWRKEGDKIVVCLKRGEKIALTLNEFFERSGIKGGFIQGIGAVDQAELASFSIKEKKFNSSHLEGFFELTSFMGTISEIGLHAHTVLSDAAMKCYGGHFMEARICITGEFFITEMKKIRRADDKLTGLKFMEL